MEKITHPSEEETKKLTYYKDPETNSSNEIFYIALKNVLKTAYASP